MERKGKRMGYQARGVDMSRVQDRAAGRAQQTAQSVGNEHQRRSKTQRYTETGNGLKGFKNTRSYWPGKGHYGSETSQRLRVYNAWLDGRPVKQTELSSECAARADRLGISLCLQEGYYYPIDKEMLRNM